MGLLFVVTGVWLTFNLKADSVDSKGPLAAPGQKPNLDQAAATVQSELARRGIPAPTGEKSLKDEKSGWSFNWNGAAGNVKWSVKDSGEGTLTVTQNGWLRRAEQLHKAKGALWFKVFSAAWALGLLTLFLTGTIMALQVKALRWMSLIAMILGTASFVALAWFS